MFGFLEASFTAWKAELKTLAGLTKSQAVQTVDTHERFLGIRISRGSPTLGEQKRWQSMESPPNRAGTGVVWWP